MLFSYPSEVDYSLFSSSSPAYAKYGLPFNVKFCRSCLVSNQRPSSTIEFKNDGKSPKTIINIDSDNICDACKAKDLKRQIDWNYRESLLRDLCDKYRSSDGSYDCLVPGSGGKDSFYQAHLLKYKYGMNPLTCTWAPNIYTDWGRKNHQSWIHAGFDNILFTPNGRVHRLITRLAVENLFHPFQPFILGQKNLAPKIAAKYNIKLVFYGENEAEYGNPLADMSSSMRNFLYFSTSSEDDIYLGGSSLSELRELGLKPNDWHSYLPIDPAILSEKQIEVHYLGFYERWHPQGAFYYASKHGNFMSSPERTIGTYSRYNSIDDKIDDFHYHTTWIKFGIGRATYDASQEIRSGDITREEGLALVRKYDGEFPSRWAEEIFSYLSLDKESFPYAYSHFECPVFDLSYYNRLADNFRSPHLWYWNGSSFHLRYTSFADYDSSPDSSLGWEGNS